MTELVKGKFDSVLREIQVSRVSFNITRYGKPVARLVPIEDEAPLTDPTAKLVPPPTSATTED